MSRAQPPPLPPEHATGHPNAPGTEVGVRLYQAICFFALAVIFLIELQRGIGLTSILVFLVGILAILSRLRFGPFLVLFVLTAAYSLRAIRRGMIGGAPRFMPEFSRIALDPVDLLLSVMMLIFVVGHYRLQALQLSVVPVDRRRFVRRTKRGRPERRSARLVSAGEIIVFLSAMLFFVLVAQAIWIWVQQRERWIGIPPRMGRLIWLIWLIGFTAIVVRLLLRICRRWQMRRDEAQMVLQDIVWRETRREQSRIHSWQAWAELRQGNRH